MQILDAAILDDSEACEAITSENETFVDELMEKKTRADYDVNAEDKREAAQTARDAFNADLDEWHANKDCPRCGGVGKLEQYKHVDGGICFRCFGDGVDPAAPKKPDLTEYYKEYGVE